MDYKTEILKERAKISEAKNLKKMEMLKQERMFKKQRDNLVELLASYFEKGLISSYANNYNILIEENSYFVLKGQVDCYDSSCCYPEELSINLEDCGCVVGFRFRSLTDNPEKLVELKSTNGTSPYFVSRKEVFDYLEEKSGGIITRLHSDSTISFDEEKLGLK